MQCPKSIISIESSVWLDQFLIWKQTGAGPIWDLEAKTADAILFLEREWQAERQYVETEKNSSEEDKRRSITFASPARSGIQPDIGQHPAHRR